MEGRGDQQNFGPSCQSLREQINSPELSFAKTLSNNRLLIHAAQRTLLTNLCFHDFLVPQLQQSHWLVKVIGNDSLPFMPGIGVETLSAQ